jgi:hypothetical protein
MSENQGPSDRFIPREPTEIDFSEIEKTKAAATNPLTSIPSVHGGPSALDRLQIQVVDVGENDPHAPPDRP